MCSSLQSKHTNQTEMLRRTRSKSWEILLHFSFEETSLHFKVYWLGSILCCKKWVYRYILTHYRRRERKGKWKFHHWLRSDERDMHLGVLSLLQGRVGPQSIKVQSVLCRFHLWGGGDCFYSVKRKSLCFPCCDQLIDLNWGYCGFKCW